MTDRAGGNVSGYRVESCGGGFYEFCDHPDAVLCSLLDPNMVAHDERDDCPIKGPHQISECGAFKTDRSEYEADLASSQPMKDAAFLLRALLARAEQAERERDEARELADGWRTLAGIQGKTGDIFEFPWEAHP